MGAIIEGTEKPLNVFLGVCEPCWRPIRVSDVKDNICPDCGNRVVVSRLMAVKTDESCNGQCMGAIGPSCSCGCGGANHGAGYAWGDDEITEDALARYRERRRKQEEKKQARAQREAERKRAAFEEWCSGGNADLVGWLTTADVEWSGFLRDMRDIVDRAEPLTERQADAVRRCMDKDRKRAVERERRAKQEAAYKASKTAVPTGKAVTVEGEILSVKFQENGFGGSLKMLVEGEGYRVWTTAPQALVSKATDGFLARASEVMRGKRVRFVADVTASGDDEGFGFAKRPRKAQLVS